MNKIIVEDIDNNDTHTSSITNKKPMLSMPKTVIITATVSTLIGYCFTVYINAKLGYITKLTINGSGMTLAPAQPKIVAIQSVA